MNLLYHIAASLEFPSSPPSSSPSSPASSSSSTSPRDYDPSSTTFSFTDNEHAHRHQDHILLSAKTSTSSFSSFSSSSSSSYTLPSTASFSSPHLAPASLASPSSSSRRASFSDTLSVTKQKLKSQHNRKRPSLPQDVFCRSCLTTKSPEWRRGPDGLKSLCNACGLRFAQMVKKEQLIAPANPSVSRVRIDNLLN